MKLPKVFFYGLRIFYFKIESKSDPISFLYPHTYTIAWYIFKRDYKLGYILFTFVSKFRCEAFTKMTLLALYCHLYDVEAFTKMTVLALYCHLCAVEAFTKMTMLALYCHLYDVAVAPVQACEILVFQTFIPNILSLHICGAHYHMQRSETDESLCVNSPC